MDSNIVALVSIIASSTIALVSLVLSPLVSFFVDSFRWKRERKAAEAQRIEKSAIELLTMLSAFRSGYVTTATGGSYAEAFSKLLTKYYAWEIVIRPYCTAMERQSVDALRAQFENGDAKILYDKGPRLANEILDYSYTASGRVK